MGPTGKRNEGRRSLAILFTAAATTTLLYREFVEEAFRYIGRELEWEGSGDTEVCCTGRLYRTTVLRCRSGGRREAGR